MSCNLKWNLGKTVSKKTIKECHIKIFLYLMISCDVNMIYLDKNLYFFIGFPYIITCNFHKIPQNSEMK